MNFINFTNFYKSARDRPWNHNTSLRTKFHRNRMIPGRDIAIKPFSKWRPSAILNFQNLVFWSRDLCLNVILLLHAKFRVYRTINRGDYSQKTIFNMATVLTATKSSLTYKIRDGSSRKFVGVWPLEGVDCVEHCLLVELKLCNVNTCIGGKTGGRPPPGHALNRACIRSR